MDEYNELEALNELKFQVGNITYFTHDLQATTYKVRDSGLFEVIEKALKVLELLKKKKVDLSYLDFVLKSDDPDETKLKKYNRYYACEKPFYLTKKEFNQIKEWLGKE